MPASSRHKKQHAAALGVLALFLLYTRESDVEKVAGIIAAYESKRLLSKRSHIRGPYNAVHSDDFFIKTFFHSSRRRFKSYFRMDKESFDFIHDLIKGDEVFISSGRKPQRPVWYQLAVFLIRYGKDPTERTAQQAAIAEGTVYLYCSRIVTALRKIRPQYISWPAGPRKAQLKSRMADEGFPGCIGMVDGSLIPLAIKPVVDGEHYFCRKKFYAIILQGICDDTLRFTEYDLGWPGSVQDTTVFRESGVWRNRADHFAHDEFLLADKGYPLTKFTIRPFAECDLTNDPAEITRRREFNFRLSSLRITIEHAFGMLKGRFPALRDMPGVDMNAIYTTVEAIMVIHNILIDLEDDPTEIDEYYGIDDLGLFAPARNDNIHDLEVARQSREINNLVGTNLHRTGLYRRKCIMEAMGL